MQIPNVSRSFICSLTNADTSKVTAEVMAIPEAAATVTQTATQTAEAMDILEVVLVVTEVEARTVEVASGEPAAIRCRTLELA